MQPPGGGRWQIERGLYRNSLNAMLRQEKLDVTEAMMIEKTLGTKSMMGPEWEPAGIVSRKIAELMTNKTDKPQPVPQVQPQRAMSQFANAGASLMGYQSQQQLQQQPEIQMPESPQQQHPRRYNCTALDPPSPLMQQRQAEVDAGFTHQIDYQSMRAPARGMPPGPGPVMAPTMMTSKSATALSKRCEFVDPNPPPVARGTYKDGRVPISIQAEALPKRMALGTKSSPTLQWYPGVDQNGKLGNNRERCIPKRG